LDSTIKPYICIYGHLIAKALNDRVRVEYIKKDIYQITKNIMKLYIALWATAVLADDKPLCGIDNLNEHLGTDLVFW